MSLPTDDTDDRRAAPRHSVDLPSRMRINGHVLDCRVIELSRHGARVEAPMLPQVDTHVALELPNSGTVVARVIRVTESYFALAFPGVVVISPLVGTDRE
ncbi:MAG: PilZ domain-containing protein [Rhodospirillaceae bacterium]|nr:PilZ domain-containing protein [Rhodospirillaceae bacterium]